jgi:endonuclease-3 related protein
MPQPPVPIQIRPRPVHPQPPLRAVFGRLLAAYGPQHWWPGESRLEIMVGAILVQNTAWANAARAIQALVAAGHLTSGAADNVRTLHALGPAGLALLIRPAGTYRIKAQRLWNLLDWLLARCAGSIDQLAIVPTPELRAELRAIPGIGPETADAICLYACDRPTFVIDAYARRVLSRHGWASAAASYHAMQELFHRGLPAEAPLFNEFHALLVAVGKHHCRAVPRCADCPLACLLPAAGPYADP